MLGATLVAVILTHLWRGGISIILLTFTCPSLFDVNSVSLAVSLSLVSELAHCLGNV